MGDITSANAVFTLTIPGVFTAPQQIQGYAVDSAFDIEAVDVSENKIGVDGLGSSGLIYNLIPMTVNIQADSPSILLFETWLATNQGLVQSFACAASIVMPSIGRKYTMPTGYLKKSMQMASAGRVLKERPFTIDWVKIIPANL